MEEGGVVVGVGRNLCGCSGEEELRALRNEILLVISQLPDYVLVGLIVFDSFVRVYDLGFTECLRVVLFNGERQVSSDEVHFSCSVACVCECVCKVVVDKFELTSLNDRINVMFNYHFEATVFMYKN